MDIKVKSLFLKVAPQKVRPTLYGLVGQNAEAARVALGFINKKGAVMIASLLKSAIAVARENDLDIDKISIKEVYCTEGPRLKRRHIGSRGRSEALLKRMSHLTLIVSDLTVPAVDEKVEKKKDKPELTKKVNK